MFYMSTKLVVYARKITNNIKFDYFFVCCMHKYILYSKGEKVF